MDAASPDATLGRYRAPETPPARPRDRGGTIARGSVGEGRPEADMRMSVESRGNPGTYLTCI